MTTLFDRLKIGTIELSNRIIMSPMTRSRADDEGVQPEIAAEYYRQRASAGLIITEATNISPMAKGYVRTPGIYTPEQIESWRSVTDAVHAQGGKIFLQIFHTGRIALPDFLPDKAPPVAPSPVKANGQNYTDDGMKDFVEPREMTIEEIRQTVKDFAAAAKNAIEAGFDGVELHAANGYLVHQFLGTNTNLRTDEYGGSLENRARFVREIVRAIRAKAGADFHLQVKISAADYNNAIFFWEKKGTTLKDSIQVCNWLVEEGVDAIHVSSGNMFPHPRNPMGGFPVEHAVRWYDTMLSSGIHTQRNYFMMRNPLMRRVFLYLWHRSQERPENIEGALTKEAHAIRDSIRKLRSDVPVICTGGFQTASKIFSVIDLCDCDAVSIARPLVANNDMVRYFERGEELPEKKRCTYCNRCLLNALENPLACYEPVRFDYDYDAMTKEALSVFKPAPFR